MGEHVSMQSWDGRRATSCCGPGNCPKQPIMHVELEALGSEYAAELDFCGDHIEELSGAARMFLVALGIITPTSDLDRNARAVTAEFIPPQRGSSTDGAA